MLLVAVKSNTAGANADNTMRCCGAGRVSVGKEQPAGDAPHERGAGVRDGVTDGVDVAVPDDHALCDAEADGSAAPEGDAEGEGCDERDHKLLAVPHSETAALSVRDADGGALGDCAALSVGDADGSALGVGTQKDVLMPNVCGEAAGMITDATTFRKESSAVITAPFIRDA